MLCALHLPLCSSLVDYTDRLAWNMMYWLVEHTSVLVCRILIVSLEHAVSRFWNMLLQDLNMLTMTTGSVLPRQVTTMLHTRSTFRDVTRAMLLNPWRHTVMYLGALLANVWDCLSHHVEHNGPFSGSSCRWYGTFAFITPKHTVQDRPVGLTDWPD